MGPPTGWSGVCVTMFGSGACRPRTAEINSPLRIFSHGFGLEDVGPWSNKRLELLASSLTAQDHQSGAAPTRGSDRLIFIDFRTSKPA